MPFWQGLSGVYLHCWHHSLSLPYLPTTTYCLSCAAAQQHSDKGRVRVGIHGVRAPSWQLGSLNALPLTCGIFHLLHGNLITPSLAPARLTTCSCRFNRTCTLLFLPKTDPAICSVYSPLYYAGWQAVAWDFLLPTHLACCIQACLSAVCQALLLTRNALFRAGLRRFIKLFFSSACIPWFGRDGSLPACSSL